jgi:hypothetical protein
MPNHSSLDSEVGCEKPPGIPSTRSKLELPFHFSVLINSGLPIGEEANKLNELEENIERALTEKDDAVFVASITTNGMREFVFYAAEWKPQYFEQKVDEAVKDSDHKPQFMMQKDRNWDTYRKFAK